MNHPLVNMRCRGGLALYQQDLTKAVAPPTQTCSCGEIMAKIMLWTRLCANKRNQSCNVSIRRGLVNEEEKSFSRRREKSKLHAGIFISKRGDWNFLILAEMSDCMWAVGVPYRCMKKFVLLCRMCLMDISQFLMESWNKDIEDLHADRWESCGILSEYMSWDNVLKKCSHKLENK